MRISIPPVQLHSGQREILEGGGRYKVISAGRRFGKTMLAIEWLALLEGGVLDGTHVGYFAPSYSLLREVWHHMVRTLRPVIYTANKTEKRVELITGGVIDFWTLENKEAGRGNSYDRVVID